MSVVNAGFSFCFVLALYIGFIMQNDENVESVLFGFLNTPSCGWEGEDTGGFSIDIYPDGRTICKSYLFDRIEIYRKELQISEESVAKITSVLKSFSRIIKRFNSNYDNGSCDGNGHFFILSGEEYTAWNIDNEYDLRFVTFCYIFRIFTALVNQGNQMNLIFLMVSAILDDEGITLTHDKLSLDSFESQDFSEN